MLKMSSLLTNNCVVKFISYKPRPYPAADVAQLVWRDRQQPHTQTHLEIRE